MTASRAVLVALACYVAVTVVLPFLDGAAAGERFASHAALVVGVSVVIGLVAGLASRRVRRPVKGAVPTSRAAARAAGA